MLYLVDGQIIDIFPLDLDSNGNPLGLKFTLKTKNLGPASLNFVLIKDPIKPNGNDLLVAEGEEKMNRTISFEVENEVVD